MKFAVIGKGKTGSKVLDLLNEESALFEVFDTQNQPQSTKLKECDVAVCFVAGHVMEQLIPELVEAAIPVVSGATGINWPQNLDQVLKEKKLKWIYASNFSIGMNLVYQLIQTFKQGSSLFDQYSFFLNEVHHTKKLDAPSGTALKWKDWLGHDVHISSQRLGDVVGTHTLTLKTPYEEITLTHDALDRKIFAHGAIWAAKELIPDARIGSGLHQFEKLTANKFFNKV